MNKIMLLYPPGKKYQRGEDRAQSNIEESTAASVHACNDLGYAAAVLLKENMEVFLRDYQTEEASFEDVKTDVIKFRPDLIVLSTTNATVESDIRFVNEICQFHDCKFVLKGAIFFDAGLSLLDTLDLHNVTCLVATEIDSVIADLAKALLLGTKKIEEVPGIIFKTAEGFQKTDFCCKNTDLDALPFPARQLMNNNLYVRPDTGEPMATIDVARGCPAQCIYCLTPIITGRDVRFRSTDSVMSEIRECFYKFNIHNFFFRADTFTINEPWVIDLCDKIIASDLLGKIYFTVNSRTNTLSSLMLKKLKEAGCFTVAIGFESGSDETLKKIKKGAMVADSFRAAEMVRQAGLPLFGFFMIGFPWETKQDIKKTISLIFKLKPDFMELHIAMPYYGTELYTTCKEYGTIRKLAWSSDYFSPNTIGTVSVPMQTLKKIRKITMFRFYSRPSFLWNTLKKFADDPSVIKHYLYYAVNLLKNIHK